MFHAGKRGLAVLFLFFISMALTPESFLRRVIEEEPQTFEGDIAKRLLRYFGDEFDLGDPEDVFAEYRESLIRELDAVNDLQKQFLREEYDEYRAEQYDEG